MNTQCVFCSGYNVSKKSLNIVFYPSCKAFNSLPYTLYDVLANFNDIWHPLGKSSDNSPDDFRDFDNQLRQVRDKAICKRYNQFQAGFDNIRKHINNTVCKRLNGSYGTFRDLR